MPINFQNCMSNLALHSQINKNLTQQNGEIQFCIIAIKLHRFHIFCCPNYRFGTVSVGFWDYTLEKKKILYNNGFLDESDGVIFISLR